MYWVPICTPSLKQKMELHDRTHKTNWRLRSTWWPTQLFAWPHTLARGWGALGGHASWIQVSANMPLITIYIDIYMYGTKKHIDHPHLACMAACVGPYLEDELHKAMTNPYLACMATLVGHLIEQMSHCLSSLHGISSLIDCSCMCNAHALCLLERSCRGEWKKGEWKNNHILGECLKWRVLCLDNVLITPHHFLHGLRLPYLDCMATLVGIIVHLIVMCLELCWW